MEAAPTHGRLQLRCHRGGRSTGSRCQWGADGSVMLMLGSCGGVAAAARSAPALPVLGM